MTKSLIRDYTLQGIADTIREKKEVIGSWSTQDENTQYVFNHDGTGTMTLNGESTPITYEYSSSNNQLAITKPIYHYLIKNGRYTQESGGFTIELHAATAELKVDEEEGKLHLYSGIWGASYFYNNTPFTVSDYNEIVFDYSHTPNGNQSFNVLTDSTYSASSVIENIVTPGGGYTGRITRKLTIPKPVPQTMDRLYCDVANLGDKPAEVTPTSRYGVEIWNVYFEGTQTDTYTCAFNDGVMTLEDTNQNEIELNNLDKFLPSEMDDEIDALPYFDTDSDVFNTVINASTNVNTFSYIDDITIRVSNISKIQQLLRINFKLFKNVHIIGNISSISSFKLGIGTFNILDLSELEIGTVNSVGDQFIYLYGNAEKLILPKKSFTVTQVTPKSNYYGAVSFYPSSGLKHIENLVPFMASFKTNFNFSRLFYISNTLQDELTLDFTGYDIDNGIIFINSFYFCSQIPKITFIGDNLELENLSSTFYNCENLSIIDGLDTFKTDSLTNMASTFYGCSKLISFSPFTSLPECLTMSNAYRGLKLFSGDFDFTAEKVTDLSNCFYEDELVKNIEITFGASSIVNLSSTFYKVNSKADQGSSIITLNNLFTINNMSSAFSNCKYIKQIIMPNADFETSTTSYSNCFSQCINLEVLDIRSMDFSKMSTAPTSSEFGSIPSTCTIYVKDAANKTLLLAANSNFGNNVVVVS